jgi:hypothetical protein
MATTNVLAQPVEKGSFWLPNALFFALIHLGALLGGIYLSPPNTLCKNTIILTVLCWQLPCFGLDHFFWQPSTSLTMTLAGTE